MPKLKAELRKYLLGFVFIAAALLGGGAAPGLWTDTVLQILILVCATPVLAARDGETIDPRVKWLCGLIVAVTAIQLLPLPVDLVRLFRTELLSSGRMELVGGGLEFISLGLGRTLEALLYVAVLIILQLALLRLPGDQLHALLPFLLVGVACNGIAALIQYSASSRVMIDGLLPYTIMAGFFANRNHFSSLLYTALPFLLYLATFKGSRLWSVLGIFLVLLVLLAAGSRAGVLLGLAALVLSVAFFASRSRIGIWGMVIVVAVLGAYSAGTWALIEARDLSDLTRAEFASTTITGIKDNWFLGIGYGNFPAAYQVYEDPGMIFQHYVNHAHNDYLELIFEGGMLAVLLMLAYLGMLLSQLVRVRHSHFHKAAFLGILFVLIHSFVDYPLRTMAVATAFVYFNAIFFHRELQPQGRHIKGIVDVRDGSRTRRFVVTDP
ncbi:O-antigen ligase family protein [Ochrobactrum sp. A-1]|uniref:O-antigen ligase family protein n=1 Tax=Ochrobactrum sp. A-1 TaxID=2920940 RepID=UPI001F0A4F49|nr:O-antigen ligase family protein [Ochrobactrum sp. A-1]